MKAGDRRGGPGRFGDDGSISVQVPTALGRTYRIEANNQFPGVLGGGGGRRRWNRSTVSVPDPAQPYPKPHLRVKISLP